MPTLAGEVQTVIILAGELQAVVTLAGEVEVFVPDAGTWELDFSKASNSGYIILLF